MTFCKEMKTLVSAFLLGLVAILLAACSRDHTDRAEIKREVELMDDQGWDFVEMVGEAHGLPEGREIRYSDDGGALMVTAINSGANGYGNKYEEFKKTFKDDGFDFLEVKIVTSPADVYSLVFRKSNSSEDAATPNQKKKQNKSEQATPRKPSDLL